MDLKAAEDTNTFASGAVKATRDSEACIETRIGKRGYERHMQIWLRRASLKLQFAAYQSAK